MMAMALIIVGALVLGWSPGLALIAIALILMAVDGRFPFPLDQPRP